MPKTSTTVLRSLQVCLFDSLLSLSPCLIIDCIFAVNNQEMFSFYVAHSFVLLLKIHHWVSSFIICSVPSDLFPFTWRIQVAETAIFHFFFLLYSIVHIHINIFLYLIICHWTFGYWTKNCNEYWCAYILSFLCFGERCQEVGSHSQVGVLVLVCWEVSILPSTESRSDDIPTTEKWA